MIGLLPTSLKINGVDYAIRSDYKVILNIYSAFNDPELSEIEKAYVCIRCLYTDLDKISTDDYQEAVEKAFWFVNGGDMPKTEQKAKTIDWEQDESIIFSAVNKVAGYEVRSAPYLHWWTFLGYFCEVGDGLLNTVIAIRTKKSKGKKLEKHELEFYREHKSMIDLKTKYTVEEQAEIDRLNELLR